MRFRAAALRQRSAGPLVGEAYQLGGRHHRSDEYGGLSVKGLGFHAWIQAAEQSMTDVEDIGGLVPSHR